MQHPRTERFALFLCDCGIVSGCREVDNCYVDWKLNDDVASLAGGSASNAMNSQRLKKRRQLIRERIFAPTAVCQQQIQSLRATTAGCVSSKF
jgi:hypothetical protein